MHNGPPQTSLGLEPFQSDRTALFRNQLKNSSQLHTKYGKRVEQGPYSIQQVRRKPTFRRKETDGSNVITYRAPEIVLNISSDHSTTIVVDGFVLSTTSNNRCSSSGSDGMEEARQNQEDIMMQWKLGLAACRDVLREGTHQSLISAIRKLLTSTHLSDLWYFFNSLSLNPMVVPSMPRVELSLDREIQAFDVEQMEIKLSDVNEMLASLLNIIQTKSITEEITDALETFAKTLSYIINTNISAYCNTRAVIGSMYKRVFNAFLGNLDSHFNTLLKFKAMSYSDKITTPSLKNKNASSTSTMSTCDTVFTSGTNDLMDLVPYTDNHIDMGRCEEYTKRCLPYYAALSKFTLDQFFHLIRNDEMFAETRSFAWSLTSNMRDVEIFRRNSMVYILEFCNHEKLRENTLHESLRLANLMIYDYMSAYKIAKGFRTATHVSTTNPDVEVSLKYWLSLGVWSAIRTSIKIHESCAKATEILSAAKLDGLKLCCDICLSRSGRDRDLGLLMEWEIRLGRLLAHDKVVPGHPYNFIDRLLTLGGWPSQLVEEYRALSVYIIVRCTIAPSPDVDCTELAGVSSLKVASACLAIAIKICNLQSPQYEFWPKRLQAITGFGFNKIAPIVTYCGMLLRTTLNPQNLDAALSQRYPNNHRYWI